MTNNGDQREPDDGAHLIRLGTGQTAASSSPASAPAAAARSATPPPPDPFAPSRFRPSRRVAAVIVVVAVLVAGAAVGVPRYLKHRQSVAEAAQWHRTEHSMNAVQSVIDGYRLPAPMQARSSLDCWRASTVCATTDLAPRAAIAAVLADLAARGITAGASSPSCDSQGSAGLRCALDLRYAGGSSGSVRAVRDDVAYRVFGQPTAVEADFPRPDQYSNSYFVTVPATPFHALGVVTAAMPTALSALARCTGRGAAGGCVRYVASATLAGTSTDLWRDEGRRLVAAGWPDVHGFCPGTAHTTCLVDGYRNLGANGQQRVTVSVTITARGARTGMKIEVTSRDGSVAG